MMLGLSIETFTTLHVVLSLAGIVTGWIVLLFMIRRQSIAVWNELFLATTVLTSVTGFLFPPIPFGPSHLVGVLSLVVLAIALFALQVRRLSGWWRRLYADCAVAALYLNCFVGVAQAFGKLPTLKVLAPTPSAPAVLVAQGALLAVFFIGGFLAQRRFASLGVDL
jgi:hypothetical protein